MMDSSFAAAYIDNGNSYRFLGVRVRPFSMWHLFLLQTISSPFAMGGAATMWDLRTAIGVCRLKFSQSKIRRPFMRWMTKNQLKWEIARFSEYMGDYTSTIEYNIVPFDSIKSDKPEPRIVPAPNVVTTVFNAAHGARVSIEEAWNMSIGQAQIAQAMHFHMQGARVNFMDDDEREFQANMKEKYGSDK